jgi:hypothetical protein
MVGAMVMAMEGVAATQQRCNGDNGDNGNCNRKRDRDRNRMILNFFFAPGVRRVCARCAPGVRPAWRRWLSAPQLDVLNWRA